MRAALAIGMLVVGVGCAPAVPANPTYLEDVQPILQANCGRCHGPDPQEPQISFFRLDRFVKGDDQSRDAWDYRAEIIRQAVDLEQPPMPPDFPLSDRQRQILRRWVEQDAPKGTRDNALPQAELLEPAETPASVDQSLALAVRSWDDDGDGLWVQLFAREVGTAQEFPLARRFGEGIRRATADTGVLPSGRRYEIFAALDDGFSDDPAENRTDVTLIDSVLVDHGARGTAPLVQLLQPNRAATIFGTTTIAWSASDPDPGDALSMNLDLYQFSGSAWVHVKSIASGLPNGPQSYQWTPDVPATTPQGSGIRYRMRVTARDLAGNVRFDESDSPFSVAPPPNTTTFTWDDVRPVFVTYCAEACHGQPAHPPSLESSRLDKYDAADPVPPVNADLGVYELRGETYHRVFVISTMPPDGEPQPSAAELDMVKAWLLAGAPRDSGPTNAPPTIAWSTPNDSAVSRSSGGSITLRWSAVDPEGAPVTGNVSWVGIQAKTDTLARCTASLTGWTVLEGADVASGTATFTLPACTPTAGNTCYWCFRAQASDGTNTTVKVAIKPVK